MRTRTSCSRGCSPACCTDSRTGSSRPAVLTGNAYLQDGEPLPTNWPAAIEKFAASEFARAALGDKFVQPLFRP